MASRVDSHSSSGGYGRGPPAADSSITGELQVVLLAAVVDARGALDLEPDLAADTAHHPDQPVPVARPMRVVHRQEVQHLADPAGGHEPG
jgi:hypothetical protein